jgi:hypothetical protein
MKYIRVAIIFEPYLCSVSASFSGKDLLKEWKYSIDCSEKRNVFF